MTSNRATTGTSAHQSASKSAIPGIDHSGASSVATNTRNTTDAPMSGDGANMQSDTLVKPLEHRRIPAITRQVSRAFAVSISFVVWMAAVVANIAVPDQHGWALIGLCALLVSSRRKWIVAAFIVGAILTLYGSAGSVSYLGVTEIKNSTVATALNFFLFGALGSWAVSQKTIVAKDSRPIGRLWTVIAFSAIAVLLIRFAIGGIPILQGDAGRLGGVASLPTALGLASGALPIALAFTRSVPSRFRTVLKIMLIVLVFATASRLLIAAVLLGLASQSRWFKRKFSVKQLISVVVVAATIVVAVLRIYALRTDATIAETFTGRVANLDGVAGLVTDLIGPSLYFAARNGLVIFETVTDATLHPPSGFIFGGVQNALLLGSDPERWLTIALGFDLRSVGAIATPIWSGATIDFGIFGAAAAAVAFGAICGAWGRRMPIVLPWIAFAIVLSSYGSYLVSSQFITSSMLIVLLAWTGNRRTVQNE